MAKSKKRERRPQHSSRPSTPHSPRGRTRWIIGLGLLSLAALALFLWPSATKVAPPALDLSGFDPAVAALINKARLEIDRNGRSSDAWGNLGLALQNYEHRKDARFCLERAQQLAPKDPRWPLYLGVLALPTPEAISFFERSARLAGPTSDIPHLRLGQTLADHGRLKEAEETLSNLLRAQPQNAAARVALARVQVAANKLPQASETLRDALTDSRTALSAYQLLATIQQRLGNTPAADRARQVAASLPPDERWPDPFSSQASQWRAGEQARVDHGQQLLLQGKLSDALQAAKSIIEEYPRSAEGWLLLGRARFQNQDCPGSEAAVRQHLQINPNSVNGLTQLGIALLCQERYGEAATAFADAIRLKPDLGQAHFNLGYSRTRLGELALAQSALQTAIRCNPDFVEAYVALGELKLRHGDAAGARVLFQHAAELRPGDERIQGFLNL